MVVDELQCIYYPLQLVLFPAETADITLIHAEILLMETQWFHES